MTLKKQIQQILKVNVDILEPSQLEQYHKDLVSIVKQLQHGYYVEAEPVVDDGTFDSLLMLLDDFEVKHSTLINDEIANKVGSSLSNKKELMEIPHKLMMLSLDNLFTEEDVIKFDEKVKRFLNLDFEQTIVYSAELKVDGLSLSLRYEKGQLMQALTRGDGKVGENVLQNALTINSIPKTLNTNIDVLEVRGEVYFSKADFNELNEKQKLANAKIFANPRNAAAGTLRMLDSTVVATRPLNFIAWGLGEISKSNFFTDSFYDNLQKLKSLGFTIDTEHTLCNGTSALIVHYNNIAKKRYQIPYDIDGVVYKVNSINLQEKLGNLIKSPRWAAAHKFKPTEALTKLVSVDFQVGRTGVITPVANLEPINIGGVLVMRASLHNFSEVKRKDIRINDVVKVERAGDIIPYIVEVASRTDASIEIKEPELCPSCNSPLVYDGMYLKCTNSVFACKQMFIETLKQLVGKKAFNIEGLGEKQLELFVEKGFVRTYADVFKLKQYKAEILDIEGFAILSVEQLLAEIEKARNVTLEKFIYALGIKQIGAKMAYVLARHFKNAQNFIATFTNIAIEELENIEINGIGSSIITDLDRYFKNDQNQEAIKLLLEQIEIKDYEEIVHSSSEFFGKNILFTGTLQNLSRSAAKEMVLKVGANIVSSVSKNLDYLIVGDKPGSKLKQAQELNITILTEEDFTNKINSI